MGSRYRADDFIRAIPDSGALVSIVAKRVGCSRGTVYSWLKRPTVGAAFEAEREKCKDLATGVIIGNVAIAARQQQRTQDFVPTGDARWVLERADRQAELTGQPVGEGEARRDAGWATLAELMAEASDLERIENGQEPLLTGADLDAIHKLGSSSRPEHRSMEAAKKRIRAIAESQAKEKRLCDLQT